MGEGVGVRVTEGLWDCNHKEGSQLILEMLAAVNLKSPLVNGFH